MDVLKLAALLNEIAGDMSAEELAEKVGIPGQSMRNYMFRPRSIPKIDALAKIADYMGISLDELAERCGIKSPKKKPRTDYNVLTVEDAYLVTSTLNHRGRVDLCARLLSDAAAAYNA
jgi:transcriptional regulator with XRE-family HTH domain